MQADRFTIKTQEALQAALALAPARRHSQVTPTHLLAALLDQEGGLVTPVLGKIGVSAAALRADLERRARRAADARQRGRADDRARAARRPCARPSARCAT